MRLSAKKEPLRQQRLHEAPLGLLVLFIVQFQEIFHERFAAVRLKFLGTIHKLARSGRVCVPATRAKRFFLSGPFCGAHLLLLGLLYTISSSQSEIDETRPTKLPTPRQAAATATLQPSSQMALIPTKVLRLQGLDITASNTAAISSRDYALSPSWRLGRIS